MDRLDEIKARVEAATPGPWRVVSLDAIDDAQIKAANGSMVAGMWGFEQGGINDDDDATFIAHARSDVPWLLAEVERLRRVERAAREWQAAVQTPLSLHQEVAHAKLFAALRAALEPAPVS